MDKAHTKNDINSIVIHLLNEKQQQQPACGIFNIDYFLTNVFSLI